MLHLQASNTNIDVDYFYTVCKTVYTCGLPAILFYLHDNRHDLITCPDINGASKYRSGAC